MSPSSKIKQDERADVRSARNDGRTAAKRAVAADSRTGSERSIGGSAVAVALRTGPRIRTSLLATLALLFGVAAALIVLTGILAGPGIALGILGTVVAVGGLLASSSPTVAGRVDALLGFALSVAAVVVGLLATTDVLPWLSPETDQIARVRDWIDSQIPWLILS